MYVWTAKRLEQIELNTGKNGKIRGGRILLGRSSRAMSNSSFIPKFWDAPTVLGEYGHDLIYGLKRSPCFCVGNQSLYRSKVEVSEPIRSLLPSPVMMGIVWFGRGDQKQSCPKYCSKAELNGFTNLGPCRKEGEYTHEAIFLHWKPR